MIHEVRISSAARKDLRKAPRRVVDKLDAWVLAVEVRGLEQVRKAPGIHDEPLKGKRAGQRSIRLSRGWRAIYKIETRKDGTTAVEFVEVREVNHHDY